MILIKRGDILNWLADNTEKQAILHTTDLTNPNDTLISENKGIIVCHPHTRDYILFGENVSADLDDVLTCSVSVDTASNVVYLVVYDN